MVATPIGNLEDITLRALRILGEVDVIACEDTRQTAKLLSHYQIRKPTTSYHEHNELQKTPRLLQLLAAGKQIALVSDAGTPCISDPGYRLVHGAREHLIPVVPIPGPCSFIAALSASGRAAHAFIFLGFIPARKRQRETLLASVKDEERTLIFFESPERLLETLDTMRRIFGTRPITVARELTKIYEELFSGTAEESVEYFHRKAVKGEIVLIVEAATRGHSALDLHDPSDLRAKVRLLAGHLNVSRTEAIKHLARELNVPRRDLYRFLLNDEVPSPEGDFQ